jgi:hypothetical protein
MGKKYVPYYNDFASAGELFMSDAHAGELLMYGATICIGMLFGIQLICKERRIRLTKWLYVPAFFFFYAGSLMYMPTDLVGLNAYFEYAMGTAFKGFVLVAGTTIVCMVFIKFLIITCKMTHALIRNSTEAAIMLLIWKTDEYRKRKMIAERVVR